MISNSRMYAQKNAVSSSSVQSTSSTGQKATSTNSSVQPTKMATNNEAICMKSSPTNGNVKFSTHVKEKIDEREKYLTAKYPNHQMLLIKKRLKVEFWIDEQLKYLFEIKV